mgnify:CR=1 FL=1
MDVPYSDTFYQAERWVVYSPDPNIHKCILRAQMKSIFVKSTMFKNKILTRSEAEAKVYFKDFMEYMDKYHHHHVRAVSETRRVTQSHKPTVALLE